MNAGMPPAAGVTAHRLQIWLLALILPATATAWPAEPALVIQASHARMVTAVGISPDGRWMASGGEDGVVSLWDLSNGLRVKVLSGPARAVAALRFDSHKGLGLAATHGGITAVSAWRLDHPGPAADVGRDLSATYLTGSLDAHGDGTTPTSFAAAGINGFDVWTATGQTWRLRRAESHFVDIAVGPGGRHIATLAESGELTLWTRHPTRRIGYTGHTLDKLPSPIRHIAFDVRGHLLVASSLERVDLDAVARGVRPGLQIDVWEPTRGARMSRVTIHDRCVLTPLALSRSGHVAVGMGPTFTAKNAGKRWVGDPDPACRDTRLGLVVPQSQPQQQPRLVPTELSAKEITAAVFNDSGTVLGLGFEQGGVATVAVPPVPGEPAELPLRLLGAGVLQPVTGMALIDEGRALAVAGGKRITTWAVATGHPKHTVALDDEVGALAGWPGRERFAAASDGGTLTVWDGGAAQPSLRHGFGGHSPRLALSPDTRQLALGHGSYTPELGQTALATVVFADEDDLTRHSVRKLTHIDQPVSSLAYSEDSRILAVGHMRQDGLPRQGTTLRLLDSESSQQHHSVFDTSREGVHGLAFQPGGVLMGVATALPLFAQAGNFLLWDRTTGKLRRTDAAHDIVNSVAFSPNGAFAALAAVQTSGPSLSLWDAQRGKRLARLAGHSAESRSLVFNGNAQLLSGSSDGTVRLWPVIARSGTIAPHATLVNFGGDGGWLITAADGRFDTNNLDRLDAVAWVFPDDPLRAFPAEIFTRALYAPGLFGKLLACAGKPGCDDAAGRLAGIDRLNRVQPLVEITAVRQGAAPDELQVEVSFKGAIDPTQRNDKIRTDVYDLRLFRDGSLVGQWPEPATSTAADNLATWRQATRISDGRQVFNVRLARSSALDQVELTAYAFNEDRVKSATARRQHRRGAAPSAAPRGRAYVVSMGVNVFDDPALELGYAAKDARDMGAALASLLARLDEYEVVQLELLSERAREGNPALAQATRANLAHVLRLLAGGPADAMQAARASLREVAGINRSAVERLARAGPNDLVIVAISSHGMTDSQGQFHLLPSDAGQRRPDRSYAPARLVSSSDLSDWLRPIDAGQMALVIDACHSAASVGTPAFRPGPLGDAGLGQLAYDKGMLILAATQAHDVALEVDRLQQGLLTHALVNAGLSPDPTQQARLAADLNGNGELTLREWLRYGVQHVPRLYAAIRTNTLPLVARDPLVDMGKWQSQIAAAGQTPALFDFKKAGTDVILQRGAP